MPSSDTESPALPHVGYGPLGDAGVAFVQIAANRVREQGGLGFVFQPSVDVAIDGHLELIRQETREATRPPLPRPGAAPLQSARR